MANELPSFVLIAALLFAGAALPQPPRSIPRPADPAQEVAEKQRERIRLETTSNVTRLKSCLSQNSRCAPYDLPRLLLRLTRFEVETMLGPPQYRLQLATNNLYYWTVPFNAPGNAPGRASAVRLRVIFGDCYQREKNSRKKGVCEAEAY
jgi:hypothetical protein